VIVPGRRHSFFKKRLPRLDLLAVKPSSTRRNAEKRAESRVGDKRRWGRYSSRQKIRKWPARRGKGRDPHGKGHQGSHAEGKGERGGRPSSKATAGFSGRRQESIESTVVPRQGRRVERRCPLNLGSSGGRRPHNVFVRESSARVISCSSSLSGLFCLRAGGPPSADGGVATTSKAGADGGETFEGRGRSAGRRCRPHIAAAGRPIRTATFSYLHLQLLVHWTSNLLPVPGLAGELGRVQPDGTGVYHLSPPRTRRRGSIDRTAVRAQPMWWWSAEKIHTDPGQRGVQTQRDHFRGRSLDGKTGKAQRFDHTATIVAFTRGGRDRHQLEFFNESPRGPEHVYSPRATSQRN